VPSNETLLHEIRPLLNYEQLFGEFVQLNGRGDERTAKCAFHEDSNPSMSVNVVEGLYYCHNPECGARGDFIEFFMKKTDRDFSSAVRELARRVGINPERVPVSNAPTRPVNEDALIANYTPPVTSTAVQVVSNTVDEDIVTAAHNRLLATGASLEYLEVKRGLTRATVEEYQIGHDGDRFYIPIRDEAGRCVNIRRYKPQARRAQDKMISWRSGFGQARLYPLKAFEMDGPIYLFEGEMDTLLARQHGLNGITTTGGAGTWRNDWNSLFEGRDVVICYDVDPAGRVGSMHIAGQLLDTARSVKVVLLPLTEPVGADFTDYVVGHGHAAADFLALTVQT
jgi:DNA primase